MDEARGDPPVVAAQPAIVSVDRFGRIETRGIDYIPDEERHSRPRNIVWILTGGSITFSVIVIGWLPITFGLGWWSAVSSMVVGTAVGAALLAPMSLLAPRTGTNNPVSSGAHFGVVGRIVGSVLGLLGALAFAALTVWTGGDALVDGAHRLIGTSDGDVVRGLGYGIITAIVIGIAVLGHANMLLVQKLMVPTVGVLMLIGVIVFAGDFDSGYRGGEYLLGSFWPTWVLAALAAGSTVSSYGPFVGDWARYISPAQHSDRSLLLATGLGGFFGLGLPILFGTYIASVFADKSAAYVTGLIDASPTWYVFAIILIGLVAGTAQGCINLYGTGLDMSSIVPRLSRVKATLTIGAVAFALVYLGTFVWNAIDSVSAFLALLAVVVTPWIVINAIGLVYRRGWYDHDDLQVFNRGERGGRYWFSGGFNVRAFAAWVPASSIGMLFSNTSFFTGPGTDLLDGVDISFVVSGVLAGVLYTALVLVLPEPANVFGPGGPSIGRAAPGDREEPAPLEDAEIA
jgi:purine-cytosine permease-like protein